LFCDEVCDEVCVVTGIQGRASWLAMTVGLCDGASPSKRPSRSANGHAPLGIGHLRSNDPDCQGACHRGANLLSADVAWPRLGSVLALNSGALAVPVAKGDASLDFLQSQGLGAPCPSVENGPARQKGL
jgi:hypothetical protein